MTTHAQLADPERAALIKRRTRLTGIILGCIALGIALSIWYVKFSAQ
jgi:hypothetical protein